MNYEIGWNSTERMSYNFCPVCGQSNNGTSLVCSNHYNFIYYSGKLLWCNDYVSNPIESYTEFVKRKQKEIDDHPEWGIRYL
jgi:hypothetical protein